MPSPAATRSARPTPLQTYRSFRLDDTVIAGYARGHGVTFTLRDIDELHRILLDSLDALYSPKLREGFEPFTTWPYPPGPLGPICQPDGAPLHGAGARRHLHGVVLVVANNGWPLDISFCPGPLPTFDTGGLLDPCNRIAANHGALVASDGGWSVIHPDVASVDLVVAGRKPLGLAALEDPEDADALAHRASDFGLAVHRSEAAFDCCGSHQHTWFVEVARTEPFRDLVDLDGLGEWYATALTALGAASEIDSTVAAIQTLHATSPADFLDDADRLICGDLGHRDTWSHPVEIVGAVLGYWPPTSAAYIANAALELEPPLAFGPQHPRIWDNVRLALTEAAHLVRLDPS